MAKSTEANLRRRGGGGGDGSAKSSAADEDKLQQQRDAPDENKKRMRKKKDLPSVAYLLAHGDPETAHLPKTWLEIIGYPVALVIIFAISLLIFHHAPHDKSTHKGFKLPRRIQRPPIMTEEKMPQEQMEHQTVQVEEEPVIDP